MKVTLTAKLKMVWREENPNYLIIVKNKAGKNMDFTQFKIVQENKTIEEEKKIKVPKYKLTVTHIFGGTEENPKILIQINKIETREEVLRITTSKNKEEEWLNRCKKDYKPLEYDTYK